MFKIDIDFAKLYSLIPGKFEQCSEYRKQGNCVCCGKQDQGYIFFLPGELEYLRSIDKKGYYSVNGSDFLGRCSYIEKGNCPERAYFCRMFPLFPVIELTMVVPVSFLVSYDCPMIREELLIEHRIDILNSVHYLLSNWPELIYWFIIRKDKYQAGDKVQSPILRSIEEARYNFENHG